MFIVIEEGEPVNAGSRVYRGECLTLRGVNGDPRRGRPARTAAQSTVPPPLTRPHHSRKENTALQSTHSLTAQLISGGASGVVRAPISQPQMINWASRGA